MSAIRADDHEITLLLDRLVRLVTDHGGFVHPEIEIVSAQGELSIHSRLGVDNHDEIIFVPEVCLPGLDDFSIKLDGDSLVARPRSAGKAGAAQIEAMDLMLDLYNLSAKIHAHRQTSPGLTLINAPNVMSHLYTGGQCRPDNDQISDSDEDIIDSFFGSRRFSYMDNGVAKKVIMPIIDFLNHHYRSSGYCRDEQTASGRNGISVLHSRPLAGSSECFVRYSTDSDVLGLYIKYGFVDVNAIFLRSIPVYIDLYGVGRIKVNRFVLPMVPADKIPVEARDLHAYFPHIGRLDATTLEVSHLIIPPAQDQLSLRRILAMLIRVLSPAIDDNSLMVLVRQAESQLLMKNRNYYVELGQLVSLEPETVIQSSTVAALHQLSQMQMDKLSRYQEQCPA